MPRRLTAIVAASIVLAGCAANVADVERPDPESTCPAPDAADGEAITVERADAVLGMSEAEAQACAEALGWGFRVGRRDGESFLLTADYVPSRITVEVDDDVVVAVSVG
jgi:hypothetical protein